MMENSNKSALNRNIQTIIDRGYSPERAKEAFETFNDVDMTLSFLHQQDIDNR